MKKILFLLLLGIGGLQAAVDIDEYKVDLYYANGIMMQESEATSQHIWRKRVDILLSQRPILKESIDKTDVAYNLSHGMVADMWESFNQKTGLEVEGKLGWKAFKKFIGLFGVYGKGAKLIISAAEHANEYLQHGETLKQQIAKYKESIRAGNGVIVTAHSQGNLFTHEAFEKLDPWMKPYFHMISVASPTGSSVNDGGGVTFDNDAILLTPGATHKYVTTNPNRHDYRQITKNATGEVIENVFYTDAPSIQYHGFEYYMGYSVYENALRTGATDRAERQARQTDVAKNLILDYLDIEIQKHHQTPSQYKIKKQLGCPGRCDFRLSLEHRWDKKLTRNIVNQNVMPFIPLEEAQPGKKLGKLYKDEKNQYIKTDASAYGKRIEEILSKEDEICYKQRV